MPQNSSPAEAAAQIALDQVFASIEEKHNFILEAGAGAGKTYSLIQALHRIIDKQGDELIRQGQQIACITYTNVAKDEIRARTDSHPAVLAETIHSFCWALLKDFQPHLRVAIPSLPRWPERLAEIDGAIGDRVVNYDLGYPGVKEKAILLGHEDIVALMAIFLEKPKFRMIFAQRFPILFIDEYQDTDKVFAEALKTYFLDAGEGPLVGLFGDHWQKIYGSGCGLLTSSHLTSIGKRANFRSDRAIVNMLNLMRPELTQEPKDTALEGSVVAYHTNNWQGQRRTENHWQGDLPSSEAHSSLLRVRVQLEENGWDFAPDQTKVLMLTHNVLADEQGYRNLANVFSRNESFIKKEDDYIAFLVDTIEAICNAFEQHHFGEMFSILGSKSFIRNHADKVRWTTDMEALLQLRQTGAIGQVLDHLKSTKHPRLPEKIEYKEDRLSLLDDENSELTADERRRLERVQKLRRVNFSEVSALAKFIDELTPFSTKHSVKGAEFENVLVVVGRGWNQYNFDQMLEWMSNGIPSGKQDTYERNRNLFYVACSRPKKRLALLFTQKLSDVALGSLAEFIGNGSVHQLPD